MNYLIVVLYDSGTRIKTRKRNIAAPLDPSSFADAIVQIYLEHEGDLVCNKAVLRLILFIHLKHLLHCFCDHCQELIAKDIEASDLDFSRYGETFFEVTH
jgi:hypothetical protein